MNMDITGKTPPDDLPERLTQRQVLTWLTHPPLTPKQVRHALAHAERTGQVRRYGLPRVDYPGYPSGDIIELRARLLARVITPGETTHPV